MRLGHFVVTCIILSMCSTLSGLTVGAPSTPSILEMANSNGAQQKVTGLAERHEGNSTTAAYQSQVFISSVDHDGRSPFSPPKSNPAARITTFSADTGDYFDKYRNNSALPGGRMIFTVPIGRYISPLIAHAALT